MAAPTNTPLETDMNELTNSEIKAIRLCDELLEAVESYNKAIRLCDELFEAAAEAGILSK